MLQPSTQNLLFGEKANPVVSAEIKHTVRQPDLISVATAQLHYTLGLQSHAPKEHGCINKTSTSGGVCGYACMCVCVSVCVYMCEREQESYMSSTCHSDKRLNPDAHIQRNL